MEKFLKILTVLSLLSLLMISACSSNGGNSADSYSLNDGNHALLGPLDNANVKICELAYTDNYTCEETTTDRYGTFNFSNTNGWSDDTIVLVIVSGGDDIDVDDDGFIDETPTTNKGVLHAFAKVSDLEAGNVNVTVLTDMAYQYVSHLCNEQSCSLAQSDLENALNLISDKLVETKTISSFLSASNSYFGSLIKFNPLTPEKTPLKIEISKLKEMTTYYHKGDKKGLENLLNTGLGTGLVLNNPALEQIKNNLMIKFIKPKYADIEISKGSESIFNKNTIWFNPDEDMGKIVQLKIKNLDVNYQIIKWIGCDEVKDNGTTCEAKDLQEDRVIAPVILPKLTLNDNITNGNIKIIDITGANITFNNISNNDNISLNDIEPNSPLLDNITVETSDTTLIDNLTNLNPGDIIVNKSEPVFFRKVINIISINNVISENINTSNPNIFLIITEFIPLTKIFPRGYITTLVTPETVTPEIPIHYINGDITLGNTKVPYNPTRQYLIINLDTGEIATRSLTDASFNLSGEFEDNYSKYLDEDNKSQINATIKLRPYVDLNIGWSADASFNGVSVDLDGIYLSLGSDIEILGNATAQIKKTYSTHKILYDKLEFNQTFTIYGIPIKVKEKIPIVYGIKGAGEGKDYDNASIVGNAKITFSGTCSPVFNFAYNGVDAESSLTSRFNFSQTSELNAGANAFAYIGAEPAVYVYGIGVGMNNYVGPYLKLNLKAGDNATGEGTIELDDIINDNLTLNTSVKIEGSLGVGYYGRIVAASTWNTDVAKKVVNKINEKIRGKYTEFWKEYPLYTVEKEFETSSTWGITDKPGELQVIGNKNIIINTDCTNSSNKIYQYQFTLKNIGDHPIDWLIETDNDTGDALITFNNNSGTLNGGDNTTITMEINYTPACGNTYNITDFSVYFKQKTINAQTSSNTSDKTLLATTLTLMPVFNSTFNLVDSITKYKTNVRISEIPSIDWTPNLNVDESSVYFQGISLSKLNLTWDKPDNTTDIDGYTIFYSDNCTNNTASFEQYKILADITNIETQSTSILPSPLEIRKYYCFKIYAYKQIYYPPLHSYLKTYFSPDNATEVIYPSYQ
ncbi:hypothetical protein DEFDS_0084 [Deferribacter desulfuricans SSM1]|uniref:Fibronectin type-III domain-containing protein n=1 Tax=Deferribacter desulfuricans (strain DSM 14783 / JCM 11476 / NBRC 101012 / SSM1) TaxID=639282 RepID=D3PAH3_DEFDS|nr:hypothetical protein [Deferribacter desulfuricans]BAI79596.1 hypothetical protein DEFDS_0084 [Deferribacter desulfuricans SSM1]